MDNDVGVWTAQFFDGLDHVDFAEEAGHVFEVLASRFEAQRHLGCFFTDAPNGNCHVAGPFGVPGGRRNAD
ncbi:hypothetical protein D3C72_2508080 [compost metagenome]